MTGLTFARPAGAAADVKELEYIIALQQTSAETRSNATVSSLDVQALIRSRYSLRVPHGEMAYVVRALGGGDTVHDEEELAELEEETDDPKASHKKSFGSRIHSLMHRSGSKDSGDDKHHDDDDDNDHDNGTSVTASTSLESPASQNGKTPPQSSQARHKNRMHKLHYLHGDQHADEKSMHALKDEITADLTQKVVQNTKSKRNLQVDNDDDDDDEMMEKKELTGYDDSSKSMEVTETTTTTITANDDEDGTTNNNNKSVAFHQHDESSGFQDEPTRHRSSLKKFKSGVDDDMVMSEYLDLVQILSTLLIPKLARVARDAQLEAPEEPKGNDNTDNIIDNGNDEDEDDDDAGAMARLGRRFVSYGRRKLLIDKEQETKEYEATRVMELTLDSLLKNIPLDDGERPVVDETLIQLLLLQHGEVERANNPELIQAMVQAAVTDTGSLDVGALAQAISLDLRDCWDPSCQDEDTTFFHDVFGVSLPSITTVLHAEPETLEDIETSAAALSSKQPSQQRQRNSKQNLEDTETTKSLAVVPEEPKSKNDNDDDEHLSAFAKCMKFLFPVISAIKRGHYEFSTAFLGIDMVTDSAASLFLQITIFLFFILVSVTYGGLLINAPGDINCGGSVGWCTLGLTIYSWALIAAMLIAMGMWIILPLSVGNNPADTSVRRKFFSMIVAAANSVIPFLVVRAVKNDDLDKVSNESVKGLLEDETFDIIVTCTFFIGIALAAFYFFQGFSLLLRERFGIHLPQFVDTIVSGAASNAEVRVYRAAKFKINRLFSNALGLHESDEQEDARRSSVEEQISKSANLTFSHKMALKSTSDQTSRNFVLRGERLEDVGGVFWSFWKVLDGSLFNEEGVWLNTRLLIVQVTQVFLIALITVVLLYATVTAAQSADDYRADMDPDLPDWVKEIFPTSAMVLGAFIPASFVTMGMMIFLTMVYIPSSVATVLKYRGAILPSLGSPYFQKFRTAVDSTYMNTANAIYGMIGSSVLFYFVVGAAIFLFLWPYTQDFMFLLVAWGIGLGITIGIKMVITQCYQKVQYRSFYRIKPAAARVTSLALECWHIGLAGSVLIARIGQFLAAALFWVGRIDVPLLSEDVVLFGYGFDLVPNHYWKDLLVHEAHRHPYIEQLSQMFLMKLRYGDRFINDAGTVWRQLVVLALFPWLAKKRVFRDERKASAEIDAEDLTKKEAREADAFAGAREMKDGALGAGQEVGSELVDAGHEIVGVGGDIVVGVGKTFKKGAKATTNITSNALPSKRNRNQENHEHETVAI